MCISNRYIPSQIIIGRYKTAIRYVDVIIIIGCITSSKSGNNLTCSRRHLVAQPSTQLRHNSIFFYHNDVIKMSVKISQR